MTSTELLSQSTDPRVIRSYLDWHVKQGLSLVLLTASTHGHIRAQLTGYDPAGASMVVACTGMGDFSPGLANAYSLVGTTARGANFLASGTIERYPGTADCFKLSFPDYIDISQSRDCHRCPAPGGLSLHLSSQDPHLNDIVCKVQNVSLGGLAILWGGGRSLPEPKLGTIAEAAILVQGTHQIQLDRIAVTHITRRKSGTVIGLKFERDAPRAYASLVLDAQRSQYLA